MKLKQDLGEVIVLGNVDRMGQTKLVAHPGIIGAIATLTADLNAPKTDKVPLSSIQKAWTTAIEECGTLSAALLIPMKLKPSNFGLFGYMAVNAPSFAKYLSLYPRFSNLIHPLAVCQVLHAKTTVTMRQSLLWHPESVTPYGTELLFANLLFRARALFSNDLNPLTVRFSHKSSEIKDDYDNFFKTSVEFGHLWDEIAFDERCLSLPNQSGDSNLFDLLEHFAQKEILEIQSRENFWIRSIKQIVNLIKNKKMPSIESLARSFNLSVRSYQRVLQDEGISFSEIKDAARRSLCHAMFEEKKFNIELTAEALGYRDANSLAKAHRRWFGRSIFDAV